MALNAGDKLGSFEILGSIGAGGFGAVYKARDTRLNRTVAIKVLSEHISNNAESRQRFEREAQTIAGLKHPNICVLYDVGRQDGTDFLVMEYIDGETLANRLTRGPLSLDLVLKVAIEIAGALDKAHRQGVIHRDLKPGNIMLTPSGAKLLDFGLAKLKPRVTALTSNSSLPTNDNNLTGAGAILGTLQYMAPEQLESKDADARTDIYAFGAVIYEMATGKRAFEAQSQVSLMAAILEHEAPSIAVIQPVAPKLLDKIVHKCLEKDPNARWQTAEAVGDALMWLPDLEWHKTSQRRPTGAFVAAIATVFLAFGIGLGFRFARPSPPNVPRTMFSAQSPDQQTLASAVSVSPDGTRIAFETQTGAVGRSVWIRSMDSLEARLVPAATDAVSFFWSFDGKQLVSAATDGKLTATDVATGASRTIADLPDGFGFGGSWNKDGLIIFGSPSGVYAVPEQGGAPTRLSLEDGAAPDAPRTAPIFLPDGRHFLYGIPSGLHTGTSSVHIGDVQSSSAPRLLDDEGHAEYALPGYVLFIKSGMLWAAPFDDDKLRLTGDPQAILPIDSTDPWFAFSVSNAGVLALAPPADGRSDLIWLDRNGKELSKLTKPPSGFYSNPSIAPDGRRIAVNSIDPRTIKSDIWIIDDSRRIAERFTFGDGSNSDPVWSPDGKQIVFLAQRNGLSQLFVKSLDGSAHEELLADVEPDAIPTDWSPDGKFIVYSDQNAGQLRLLSIEDRKSRPLLRSVVPYGARFSHDGKWIAYAAADSGPWQIYIQSFPDLSRKHQLSNEGGTNPRWGGNDREIFFMNQQDTLSGITLRDSGGDLEAEFVRPFRQQRLGSPADSRNHFTLSADGQRFLVRQPLATAVRSITILVNWLAALHK